MFAPRLLERAWNAIRVNGQLLDDNGVPEESRDSLMVGFRPTDDLPPGYFPIVLAKWVKVEH